MSLRPMAETTPVIRAYYNASAESVAAHGPQTVSFVQVGSFYEAYGFGSDGADVHEIAEVLRPIAVTRRDKSQPASRANPWFVGAPCHAFPKYASLLVDAGYTVVTLDQVTGPGGRIETARRVSRIFSPGVPVECRGDSNVVMCVFIEETRVGAIASAASFDIVTGETSCGEFSGMDEDAKLAIDGAAAFALRARPRETVFVGNGAAPGASSSSSAFGVVRRGERLSSIQIEEIAKLVFGGVALLDIRERVGLSSRPGCFEALATVLNFAWRRDETCIRGAALPELVDREKVLDVQESSLRQLDIACGGLLASVARPRTAGGRRLLAKRLTRPSTDPEKIGEMHQAVADRIDAGDFDSVRGELGKCVDLERVAKRLAKGPVPPTEWPSIARTVETVGGVCGVCGANGATILEFVSQNIDLSRDLESSANPFVPGARPEIDSLQTAYDTAFSVIENVCSQMNTVSGNAGFKLDIGETISILNTERRFEKAVPFIRVNSFRVGTELVPGAEVRGRKVKAKGTSTPSVAVYHDSIDRSVVRCLEAKQALIDSVGEGYETFCSEFHRRFAGELRILARACAEMDVSCAAAKTAVENGHCRPTLAQGDRARFVAEDLRHPIVESQDRETPYVGNDIDTAANVLLYGVNSSGKSCLMKSVGVAVVMAQAGLYVPAKKASLVPYRKVFTRIWSNDDIFGGKSTFVLEMAEFLDILRRACADSLVLGDELCSGTEDGSAAGIVAQGLVELTRRGCAFFFATHMHGLVDMQEVAELDRLRICHLAVHHDPRTGTLVYDRKLAPGPGEKAYGIEVLKGLGFPIDFVSAAYRFRRVAGSARDPENVVAHRPSRYNSKVNVTVCYYCGKPADHTHHVSPQETAERHVKNRRFNLHPVCEDCHKKVHEGNLFSSFRYTLI